MKPHHSLLDWMKLNTRPLVVPSKDPIDEVELTKHSTKDDCWILLTNKVTFIRKNIKSNVIE